MNPVNAFVDRTAEKAYLEGIYAKGGKQLAVLYGRRRVGKTQLIVEFCHGKNAVYFLADKRGTLSNAERFAKTCAEHYKDVPPLVKNFDDVFLYIKNRLNGEKLVVVVDEFSYLVESDPSIPSVFQLVYDEVLKGSNVFLVLCGSSISMMYKGALSYESPLYGRRSGQWFLKAMPFSAARGFYPELSFEDALQAYAVTGGVPAYAARYDGKLFDFIRDSILSKGEFLYDEPEVLLREELREPSTYFSILEAMASRTKLTDIANASGVSAKDMPKYLKVLEGLELVRRVTPVTEPKSKKSGYFLKDNFFRFWFKFVYPHKSALESGHAGDVLPLVRRDFNAYAGVVFEDVCMQYVEQAGPVPFTRVGKWWGPARTEKRSEEIDVVSLDEQSKTIMFAECKWQDRVDAEEVLQQLKRKAENVEWFKDSRREVFAVFAKSFKTKTARAHCIDSKTMDAALR